MVKALQSQLDTALEPVKGQLQKLALTTAREADKQGNSVLALQLLESATKFGKGAAGGAAITTAANVFVSAFSSNGIDPENLLESALFGAGIGGTATVLFKGATRSQDLLANIKKDANGNVVVDSADNPQGLTIQRADGTIEHVANATRLEPGDRFLPNPNVDPLAVELVKIRTQVGGEFFNKLVKEAHEIPTGVRLLFYHKGVHVLAGSKVTDVLPELVGVHPRGWPPGATWDNVDGLFNSSLNAAVVSEKFLSTGDKILPNLRVEGVFRHELGHAFDNALGVASARPAFVTAWLNDVSKIPKNDRIRQTLDYFIQHDAQDAGRSEAFAEAYGVVTGGGASKQLQKVFEKYFPNVLNQVRTEITKLATS